MEDLDLGNVRVLLYDGKPNIRRVIKFGLTELGMKEILECGDIRAFSHQCETSRPDLLLIDLDDNLGEACTAMYDIRNRRLDVDPFVVAIATTWHAEPDIVRAALKCGIDDIIMKPISVQILNQRILNLIHNRREFIATRDYIGPERRDEPRVVEENHNLPHIPVPNSLRFKATGDKRALTDDAAVQRTLEALLLQKVQRISLDITILAGELEALSGGGNSFGMLEKIEIVTGFINEIGDYTTEHELSGVDEITSSMLQVMTAIRQTATPSNEQFEILKLHSQAITAALLNPGAEAQKVARALRKAVDVAQLRAESIGADGRPG